MPSGTFPKPYQNEVPNEGSEGIMEYVDFNNMGIGARKSGTPNSGSEGPKSIEHVGNSATGKKGK